MAEKILVVDDHKETVYLVSIILKQQGYRVSSAHSGREGLALAERELPDLILLDVMMPDMDGIEVCKRIRKHPQLKDVPIIMFTAKTQADEKWEGFEAGATDYLTKPTNTDELSKRVRAILDRSKNAPVSTGSEASIVVPKTAKIALEQAKGADLKFTGEFTQRPQTIAFLGCRGGAGTTTAAINTAFTYAKRFQTLLVDYDMLSGHMGMYLKKKTAGGLNALAAGSTFSISGQIQNEVIEVGQRLHILLSQPNMSGQKAIFAPKDVPHLVDALSGYGRQVIIDAGHGVTELNQPLLERVDQIVVCIRPDRVALASSKRLIAYLKEIMLPTAILHAVMFDFGQSIAPPQSALEQYIGHKLLETIKIKRQHMLQAANGGQPLVIANPKSPLPKSFARLAKKLLTAESSL